MYKISSELYSEVADRLCGHIEDKEYFSGSFEFDFGDVHCLMRLSAVVYHHTETIGQRSLSQIADMVPVWWEFHTFDSDGCEMLNEFSFNELRYFFKEGRR